MKLLSEAFADGSAIPRPFTSDGDNLSPPSNGQIRRRESAVAIVTVADRLLGEEVRQLASHSGASAGDLLEALTGQTRGQRKLAHVSLAYLGSKFRHAGVT